jgi:GntR family transcriptional regulator
MLLELDHHSGVPIYRQIIEQIRRQIMAGQVPEGRQLMSVREMAATLRVNPMTVSKAYTLLEAEGLVERRRGIGLFVSGLTDDRKTHTKAELLEQIIARAVVTAVQLGIPYEQASQMLADLYQKYDSKIRR